MFSKRLIFILFTALVPGVVLAAVTEPGVPEMDVSGVPVVLGLTIALVMLVRDRLKK